jgi:methionyl-tRNA formyltransferase
VKTEEGRAQFAQAPEAFCWKARALHPWPLVSSKVASGRRKPETVSFHRVAPGRAAGVDAEPGTVIAAGKTGVEIACGGGSILLLEMQRAGGKVLAAEAFLNGFPLKAGDRFE